MTKSNKPNYEIYISRYGDTCEASIPQLCISAKAATAELALTLLLEEERSAMAKLEAEGMQQPPTINEIKLLPRFTALAARTLRMGGMVAQVYFMVVLITALLLFMMAPYVRSRVEQYVVGGAGAMDTGKILARLGVSICRNQ